MSSRQLVESRRALVMRLHAFYSDKQITAENWPHVFEHAIDLYHVMQADSKASFGTGSGSGTQATTNATPEWYLPLVLSALESALQSKKLPMDDDLRSQLSYVMKTSGYTLLSIVARSRALGTGVASINTNSKAASTLPFGTGGSGTNDRSVGADESGQQAPKFSDPLSPVLYYHLQKQVNLRLISAASWPVVIVTAIHFLQEQLPLIDLQRQHAIVMEVATYVSQRISHDLQHLSARERETKQLEKHIRDTLQATVDFMFQLSYPNHHANELPLSHGTIAKGAGSAAPSDPSGCCMQCMIL
jgi:hypothetical protein